MTEITHSTDHEQVNLLLPWFVNSTLAIGEREFVQDHIVDCGECREHVSLLSSVQTAASNGSPTPILPNGNVAMLFEAIDAEETTQHARPASRRFIALAASLAAAIVVIALVLVNQNQTQQLPTRFETATSANQVAAMDYVLDIRFDSESTPKERAQVLQQIDAENIVVAGGEDSYRITVNLQVSSMEDLERYTHNVESLQPVQSVEVVAMQLPVKTPE